jgi:hypothetical protein
MPKPLRSLADRFGSAARCRHESSQRRARHFWHHLYKLLNERAREQVLTAWEHAKMDDGPAELDAIIKRLVSEGL